jgi:two-component system NtrC family sensor kinase
MRLSSLRTRVSLYLILTFSLVIVPSTLLIVQREQGNLQEIVSQEAVQLAEIIVKSTRYAMLLNKRDIAEKIIDDVSQQHGIERLRVINSDGTIIHSSDHAEVGYSVDQKDEPCVNCHQTSKPLDSIPDGKRWRIVTSPGGHRSLTTMHAIRNEPTCATASCHEHPASQKVLGVVDVAYSLDDIDAITGKNTVSLISIGLALIAVVSVATAVLLGRQVYRPLRDLELAAKQISGGDLGHVVPVRHDDELGRLAAAFNRMGQALKASAAAEQALVQSLETQVQVRTQKLLVAEAEAAQGQKLASVGLLASGIAHELNNPLTGVLTFTSLLRKKMPDGSPDAEDLDLVIRETRRCASIIRRLLDFAREKAPVKAFFDLNQVISETVRFVDRPATLQNIDITLALAPALPPVWGDANLIKQVVLNVLVNAQQAITDRGRIQILTRLLPARPAASPESGAVEQVEIVIADNGCGIPAEHLQRIFDPFFTSKEVGKGTGLGLSVSYGIVKSHGGEITVDSTVDVGTRFHIVLPLASPFGDGASGSSEATA